MESGCGIGQNFVELSKMGFRRFIGIEVDYHTYLAAKELCRIYSIDAHLVHGDGVHCDDLGCQSVDIYLALNWSYFVPSIYDIVKAGYDVLRRGGLMILDSVDKDFVPWLRKERELYLKYPYRRSREEVVGAFRKVGFEIIDLKDFFVWRHIVYARKGDSQTFPGNEVVRVH
jgi:SAM-dependent methyltransferase